MKFPTLPFAHLLGLPRAVKRLAERRTKERGAAEKAAPEVARKRNPPPPWLPRPPYLSRDPGASALPPLPVVAKPAPAAPAARAELSPAARAMRETTVKQERSRYLQIMSYGTQHKCAALADALACNTDLEAREAIKLLQKSVGAAAKDRGASSF